MRKMHTAPAAEEPTRRTTSTVMAYELEEAPKRDPRALRTERTATRQLTPGGDPEYQLKA
jgi:hypothetical protein